MSDSETLLIDLPLIRKYLQDRLDREMGSSYDDRGEYVKSYNRCTPGLGWPITGRLGAGRPGRTELYEGWQRLSAGTIVRRLRRPGNG